MNRPSSFRAALVALIPMVAFGRHRAGAIAGALASPAASPPLRARPREPAPAARRPRRARRTDVAAETSRRPNAQAPARRLPPPVQTADPFGEEFTLEPKRWW